jgi:hypothetical protein
MATAALIRDTEKPRLLGHSPGASPSVRLVQPLLPCVRHGQGRRSTPSPSAVVPAQCHGHCEGIRTLPKAAGKEGITRGLVGVLLTLCVGVAAASSGGAVSRGCVLSLGVSDRV